jgi:hypothetical protein
MKENSNIYVRLTDLEHVLQTITSYLRSRGLEAVEISDDYYWDIPDDQLYDPLTKPTELDLGQLTEDWEKLSHILEGKSPTIGYALVWLSSILRAIGKEHVE